ncbi:MAG: type IV toxin-antitoxin system AbiEi family antitoxin domain-containing protein [Solirubrobacterales bacterium]
MRARTHFSAHATATITKLAAAQHGVVSRRQLLDSGVAPGLLAGRVDSGWLTPIFEGVYSPGIGLLDHRGRCMAAVLAAGPTAVLSGHSAAALHGFVPRRTSAIQVSRLVGGQRRMDSLPSAVGPGFSVDVHRTRRLPDRDQEKLDGIPVTSAARSLLDISASTSIGQIRSALTEAEKLRILSLFDLREVTSRGRGWTGTVRLRQALAEWDPLEVETRSELEIAMLRLCRKEGIPVPVLNTALAGYLPDFLWDEERLVIEVDGYRDHSGKGAFRSDRRRDVDLMIAGYRVARFTHEEVTRGGVATAARIRALLEMCQAERSP